ncbi:MAG: Na+/H+ antiporter NhaC [Clostridiales bacterium]|nr:Na+/H+ antiporter NhaC [Clostridiales bacterium]
MKIKETDKTVLPWQAMLMLVVGIAIIVIGLLLLEANSRIVLAFDGVVMCFMAYIFGIKYDALQNGIKETITSMIVAILILLAVGVLVGTWMSSGTVPVMIYYGMKILTPNLFLPVVCLLCTIMSTVAGTSWGTLATVGVACMGVAQGLGVPLEAAAGAICVGAFFGDKVSPLSDSPVITSSVTDVPLIDGIKHSLVSTGPAYIISLIFFLIYGFKYSKGKVDGAIYDEILNTVDNSFNLSPFLLLPVIVVIVLILMKKPTLPTFVAGILTAAALSMIIQNESLSSVLEHMYSGYVGETHSEVVNNMLTRGGFTSMLGTVGLLMAAGIFGAPLRTAGVVDVLLKFVKRYAHSYKSMSLGVLILHGVFFSITGAYYVSYPVVGGMVKDLYPEYNIDKKNLMRTMLDTGTGLAPMIPWSTTGSYAATTLGVTNSAFTPFAPMLWLSIIFSIIYSITGLFVAKLNVNKEDN